MDRLERLVNLVAALLDSERPLTREQLRQRVGGYAEDHEAFRRNFERDKDTLRRIGLPLVTEATDPERPESLDGYRIPRDRYELPDPGLDDHELSALRLAASAVNIGWGSGTTLSALRKLAAAVPAGGSPSTVILDDAAVPLEVVEVAGTESVTRVFGALSERRRVRFAYRGKMRTVDPWRLSYRGGQWYLSGFDHGRDRERLYRLDRLESEVETPGEPGAFALPTGPVSLPPPPWQLGEGPAVAVRVLVDAQQADWAITSAGVQRVSARREDGSVELELVVTNLGAARSWVLGFLDHAEVLGPPEVRTEIRQWLEAIAVSEL